jgi:hypothetical protein
MFRMGALRRWWVWTAAVAVLLAAAPIASAAGPIQSGLGTPASVRTLKPGVTMSVYNVTVLDAGVLRSQKIYKIAWTVGNGHVQLNSAILGTPYTDDYSIRLNRISSWYASSGLDTSMVAAINGDFFADSYRHGGAGVPSGMLVHGRTVYSFGWGGPAVGYLPSGDMVMGRPSARPTVISLPGGKTATVGAFNAITTNGVGVHGDQVAAYVTTGAKVTVPTGYVGYLVPSTLLRSTLRGAKGGYNFASGAAVNETVAAFRFIAPNTPAQTAAMPTSQPAACPSGTCAAGVTLTVPSTGVVLVAKAGSVAATGLSIRASTSASVNVSVDSLGWENVNDVMGGKPQLVTNGQAIAQRPGYVDPWQWDNAHWRPAVVRAGNGQGWLVVAGGKNGVGIKATTWAKMLVQMGAKNAMGFDNNSSTELLRPGASPITAYGYERYIPSATYLSYQ